MLTGENSPLFGDEKNELNMCLPYREDHATNMISADGFSKCEATLRDRSRRRPPAEMLHLLSAVIVWLVTGTTISSLNKWIFAVYNFRYPLLLSALHMLTAIVVDYGLLKLRVIRHKGAVEQDLTPSAKCKVFLLSLTFCASIAFGNIGLNYVQLSFAQMIYTTTPLFTLAISSLILGKQHHIIKYTAMMPICLGASFSIMGEVQFDQTGCFFVFAATMLRGVKSIQQRFYRLLHSSFLQTIERVLLLKLAYCWLFLDLKSRLRFRVAIFILPLALTLSPWCIPSLCILLQEEKINSVFLLYLMSIPSFCILAVAALALENWAMMESPLHYDRYLWVFILLSCLGSVMYNLASCCVITLTSAVTLHILGNLNVVGNLLLSQLLFGSEMSALSCAGVVLTLSGMLIYQNSEFIVSYMDSRKAKLARTDLDFQSETGEDLVTEDRANHPQRVDGKEEDKMD
ncbi:hypothetical protein GOODEAATRI_012122 [Goodea atripinnis]|uniref:Sugar phosphate transporter domain-containing protein n=1 Tax=Goodea atripinnis TaxID=208336 RepID=A0ABV0N0Q3_9TELE